MGQRKKIRFVVDTLAQHGAERYLYEILKAIDQSKFECSVLCTYPLIEANSYYKPLISDLNIEIDSFEFGELYPEIKSDTQRKIRNSITYRSLNLTGKQDDIKQRSENELHKKLSGYDLISILKIETFNRFPGVFATYSNNVIHLLSWGIQYLENPYINLPNRAYRFVTMIDSQENHVTETKFEHLTEPEFDFFPFPLLLDLNNRTNNYVARNEAPIIGVFSRMNFDQPTIMFLFAFQLLLKRVPSAKMYFYGKAINDQFLEYYKQTAKVLGITHALEFKGHVPDLKQSIEKDQITMGWMNVGNSTLGYSSIEIASYGLPVSFFNIDDHDEAKIDSRLAVFNDLEAFANHASSVISNENLLTQESNKLFDFIQSKHNAKNRILELEDYYLSLLENEIV